MFIVSESEKLPGVRFLELRGKPTDAELQTYLESEKKRLELSQNHPAGATRAMVLRLTDVWTSLQRKRMREFELEAVKRSGSSQLGMAMVVPNSLIRGAFTAYFWIAPPSYPTKMVPTAVDAYRFVNDLLIGAGMVGLSEEEFRREAEAPWQQRQAIPGKGLVPLTTEARGKENVAPVTATS